MATVQVFLSSVTAEFRSYRDALRHYLDRPNVTVKVQEEFIATGTETLDMLDLYIKECDAVIHLVGDMTGAMAQAPSVKVIRERYPDFDIRFPALTEFLKPDGPPLPYTHWEAWLALYHNKPLIICAPREGATRDERYRDDPEQRAAQQAHLARLEKIERFPGIKFTNADQLAAEVLRSSLQEILNAADVVQSGRIIDFAQERMRHHEIIGRQEEIATVRGWIDGALRGWILIKGGPGTGKSAILAATLSQLEQEFGAESIPYHFLRRDQSNWAEPDVVVPNLIARLERISTYTLHTTQQGLERLYALLSTVGQQYATNNRRLVLIVDGLDEAAAGINTEGVLGRFLPGDLPDNVFIVCASRPNYPELDWLERQRGLRTIDLDQPPWVDNNRSVVAAYWNKRGPQLKPPLEAEVLEKAIEAAEGNMLHAVTLCDVFEADTQARDAKRIPVGFNALLKDLWRRLVELKDRETSARVIAGIGLLAVAREALPVSKIAGLLDWKHPADIADFKRYALPFLLEESAEWHAGEARYRPFHESTREFLTSGDRMLPNVHRGYHELLARQLAICDGGELERRYAARFALVHLSAIGDWQRIGELLSDLQYCVAAVEAVGPQILLAHIAAFSTADKPPQLIERANILQHVLRLESQALETYSRELPNVIHNRLTCLGWSRERIRSIFSGFDRGWGLINAIDMGDEICILRGHTSHVYDCDIDSRGQYGVSGGWDGTLCVWNLARGTSLHMLRSHPEAVRSNLDSCAISPDGRWVAAALSMIEEGPRREYGRIQIWDARHGSLVVDVDHNAYGSARVAFAGNEKAIACHQAGYVDVYDIANGTSKRLMLDERIKAGIAVNSAGTLVAGITSRGCVVWSLEDGSAVSHVPFVDGKVCSFSPDGMSVAVACDDRAVIANTADGASSYVTHSIGRVADCRLLDDKRLLLTSDWDCELVIWDMEIDQHVISYQGHTYTARCCAVTPDGRLALTGGGDHTVRLWSLVDQAGTARADRHANLVYGCTVNANATFACSGPQDELPVIWNARSGTRVQPIDTELVYGAVRFCRFKGNSRVATLSQKLRVFDPETARLEWEAEFPVQDQYDRRWWADDGITEGTRDDPDQVHPLPLLRMDTHLIVWHSTGALQPIPIAEGSTTVSRLNAGRAIAVLRKDALEIIDIDGNNTRRSIADGVKACVGSPRSDSVYTAMLNGQVIRLDATSGKVLAVLGEIRHDRVSLFIDPQETVLWAFCVNSSSIWRGVTDHTLIAFSLDTSRVLQHLSIPGHDVTGHCFLSDVLITAGWSDATLRIWDPHQPAPLAVISGSAPFRCVAAARDRIVAGDQKGNVWFLAPMNELYP